MYAHMELGYITQQQCKDSPTQWNTSIWCETALRARAILYESALCKLKQATEC